MCERTVESVEMAIEQGWVPSFYDGDAEVSEPVCWECEERYLTLAEDGELELCRS